MIEGLIGFALRQRFIILALALLLTVMGVVSFRNLPIEAYPDVGDVRAEVITLWPGHAAEEVERLITIPLENELNGIARVTVIRSDTLFGLSNIRVVFADGTDDYWARQQAQERINQAQIPADAKPSLGPLSSVIGEVYRYTLESKSMSLVELKSLQDWVLEPTAIRWGVLGRDHADDLVQGIVLMRKGENADVVIKGVADKIAQIKKTLPAGVELRDYYSRDRLVRATVTTVMRNLIEGAALVVVLLSLFLYNVRAALIVAVTIPLSLLFAFIFMDLRGIPANLLSLGAIDFGIIVDGAVIMTENVVRHLSERKPTGQRVIREVQHAALEVARPLTFAVLIIMTVYVPILTFQRIEGKLFRPMAVTISLAVVGALLLTLTLIPVLSSYLFRRPPSQRESPLLALLRRPYRPAIRWCVRRPLLPILGAVALLVVSLWTFSLLGKEFLPELDEGDLWVRVQFPVGVSLEGVRPYVREIRERLLRFPQVRVVVSQLGAPDDGTDPEAPDNSEFYVGLKPREEWPAHDRDKEKLIQNMTAALADIPGVSTNFSQPIKDNVDEALAGVKGELAIKLYGPDIFVMDGLARQISAAIKDIRGVADLDFDHLIGQPQLQIAIDRGAAARYVINVQDIQDTIEAATKGRAVTEIFEQERRFNLVVKVGQPGEPVARLRDVAGSAPNGERIPMSPPAGCLRTDGLPAAFRENNCRRLPTRWTRP